MSDSALTSSIQKQDFDEIARLKARIAELESEKHRPESSQEYVDVDDSMQHQDSNYLLELSRQDNGQLPDKAPYQQDNYYPSRSRSYQDGIYPPMARLHQDNSYPHAHVIWLPV